MFYEKYLTSSSQVFISTQSKCPLETGNTPFVSATTIHSLTLAYKVREFQQLERNLLLEAPAFSEEFLAAAGRHIRLIKKTCPRFDQGAEAKYNWWCAYQMLVLINTEEKICEVSNAWVESRTAGTIQQFVEAVERWDEIREYPLSWSFSFMSNQTWDFERKIRHAYIESRILEDFV